MKRRLPTFCVETITPEMAAYYLTFNLPNNRPLKPRLVHTYAEDMRAGNWVLTHEPIAFDQHGRLYEGQHRLCAIVESGVAVQMLVVRDLPVESIAGGGRGCPRSVSDVLTMLGDKGVNSRLTSIVSIIATMTGEPRRSAHQIRNLLDKYGEHVRATDDLVPHIIGIGQAPIRGALAFCRPAHPEAVDEFTRRLVDGAGLAKGDPALTLRNHLLLNGNGGGETDRRRRFLRTCCMVERHLAGASTTVVRARPAVFVAFAAVWGFEPEALPSHDSLAHGISREGVQL